MTEDSAIRQTCDRITKLRAAVPAELHSKDLSFGEYTLVGGPGRLNGTLIPGTKFYILPCPSFVFPQARPTHGANAGRSTQNAQWEA